MKKFVLLLLALLMVVSSFAVLAEAEKPYEGTTITFWMQKYGADPASQPATIEKLAAAFYEETGITVEYSIVDWAQANTKWTLAMTGGECPDIADTFFAYSWVAIGGEEYGPAIIDDIVEEIGTDGFYEFATPECYIDGHWYALPWRGDTRQSYYNADMFAEAGVAEFPKTFDELIETAKKLTTYDANGNVDRAGMLFAQSEARFDQTFFSILAGMGGSIMDENFENFTLDTQEVRDALQFMQDALYVHNVMPKTILDPTHDAGKTYQAGKAAIIIGGGHGALKDITVNAPQLADATKAAVNPSKTGEGPSGIAFSAPICVFNGSENLDAAKEFLKFLVRPENMLELCVGNDQIPVWAEAFEADVYNTEWYNTVKAQNERAAAGDMPIPEFSQIDAFPNGPLNTMCTRVMAGEDVETCLQDCIAEVNEILAESAE